MIIWRRGIDGERGEIDRSSEIGEKRGYGWVRRGEDGEEVTEYS